MQYRPEPTIIYSNGTRTPLRVDLTFFCLRQKEFQVFVLYAVLFLALTRPYQLFGRYNPEMTINYFLFTFLIFFVYISIILTAANVAVRTSFRKLRLFWVNTIIVILVTSYDGSNILAVRNGVEAIFPFEWILLSIVNVIVVFFVEAVFVRLVLPGVLKKAELANIIPPRCSVEDNSLRQGELPSDGRYSEIVILSGLRFLATDIKRVTAHDHYVSLHTFENKSHFVRARMSDFLVQVPENLGYCIHRSHWVAWAAIKSVDGDQSNVNVDENTSLPIAKGRRSDFMHRWKARSGAWHASASSKYASNR